MKSNPGGNLPIPWILGRERLIATLWEILEVQSVNMTAERRIGKTSVIRKMHAEPRAAWLPVLMDLERIHTADEFACAVYEQVRQFLSRWRFVAHKAKQIWEGIGGTEIGGVLKIPESKGKHWKTLLTGSIEDLDAQQTEKRLVFFWDEMPYMIDSIRRRDGEETAMEVLDVLRSLRQNRHGFRMVLTGSIGLHHVLAALKKGDYKNEPVNDLALVEVPPLDRPDAQELARQLIQGERLQTADEAQSAAAIAEQADGFPFYIHSIIRHLKTSGNTADPDRVAAAVSEQLLSANDPWELRHYRDRIKSYYPGEEKIVTAILDHVATRPDQGGVNDILAAVKAQVSFDDRERLLEVLKLLQRDHYLTRAADGRQRFKFSLIQRWWTLDRGLS